MDLALKTQVVEIGFERPIERRLEKLEAKAQSANGVALFGGANGDGSPPAAEALAKARELAGLPPNIGVRPSRKPAERFEESDEEPASGERGDRSIRIEAMLERVLNKRVETEEFSMGGTATGGVKGIQKMHELRTNAVNHPGRRHKHVKAEAAEHRQHAGNNALEEYFLTREVTLDKMSMYPTSIFPELLRSADRGDAVRVKGLSCGGLPFLEQWHLTGNMNLAWGVTLLKDSAPVRIRGSR